MPGHRGGDYEHLPPLAPSKGPTLSSLTFRSTVANDTLFQLLKKPRPELFLGDAQPFLREALLGELRRPFDGDPSRLVHQPPRHVPPARPVEADVFAAE